MNGEINDRIEVMATFGHLGMQPRSFVWKSRRYPVFRIAAAWTEAAGLSQQHHFTVLTSDTTGIFELCFRPRNLAWHLLRIYNRH